MDAPLPGVYEHFKGGLYRVLMTAFNTETKEPMVVYVSLKTGDLWVRPTKMWNERVLWPDGEEHPRFRPH